MRKPKIIYTSRYIGIHNKIIVQRHALIRAHQRCIPQDMIWATIKSGRIIWFGKNYIKLERSYKYFKLICVGEIVADKIIIKTIELKRK